MSIETLRSFVNTWCADENDHLNVQFFAAFFEDASVQFQALCGITKTNLQRPVVRHVRFHSELRVNEAVYVLSHAIAGQDGAAERVVHQLYEMTSGRLSATCIDVFADTPQAFSQAIETHLGDLPEVAAGRSFPTEPKPADPGGRAPAGGQVVLRTILRSQHCDSAGRMSDAALFACNSDSAAHFWKLVDIETPWLEENRLGRVAMEIKANRIAPAFCGDPIHVVCRIVSTGRATLSFENHFVSTETGKVFAILQATGLLMDLDARRAASLPDFVQDRAEVRIREASAG